MIVILANQNDLCACQTYEYLKQLGKDVVFVDLTSDFLSIMGVNWSLATHEESFLTVNSRKIPFSEISGVLVRAIYPSYADPQLSKKDQDYIRSEFHATWIGLLNFLNCPVINCPIPGIVRSPIFANREQVKKVVQCGFQLPNMLVTSSSQRALSFYDSCSRIAILGSPWSPFLLQLIKGDEGVTHLQTVISQQVQPIYLQEVPEGKWFLCFVVGNRVFGASFWFEPLAEEKQKMPFQRIELTPKLQEQCCKLAQELQLDFLQIRLLQTESSEAHCFDVNEFPSYVQCEKQLQEEIVTALAQLLQKEDGGAK